MIFEKIYTVPTSDELLDKAFRRASRARAGKVTRNKEDILKAHESSIITASNILSDNMANIVRRFPSFDEIPRLYYELADILVGVDEIRKSLSSVDWASKKIHEISRYYIGKMRTSRDAVTVKKEAFGRIASITKSVDSDLVFLNRARNILRKLPDIYDEPTIIVAGYPNVGKSSFVAYVTDARPEIASYPFTTKGVSIGHLISNSKRYQIIDTPGLLDRPMSERNSIELQAITALEYLDAVVLYIVDASETCGYPVDQQKKLLDEIRTEFDLPVLVASNKTDIEHKEIDFADMEISSITGQGIDGVLQELISMIEKQEEKNRDHPVSTESSSP
ncbi:Nucleolar GTP-binding-1 domain protein [Methanosalsum zhilinae DSM 4017]|uniref:Nucleolar GTP-binding-1 domain protein n=1 Tax=Methanosalsum zhilinae (strain DSM 4017 / NBRC 107636 / OCM 62 / WeN5) TaxID=679901 RepID=F7XKH9_METZD|nr:GTPase [Methanosalsum zhilinae]AEH61753.1 Nucleolar GTP-binding-1 domain protein [Methanosalsum zhilinae DSM 4017]